MNKVWPFSFYFLMFGAASIFLPFLVLFYQSLEFNGVEIGLLTGLPPLITIISIPLITGLADQSNRHKLVLTICMVVEIAVIILYPALTAFILLLGITIFMFITFTPVVPLVDSATMFMLGKEKDLFGRMRLGATLGFALLAPVGGWLVEQYGLATSFRTAAGVFTLAALVSLNLRHRSRVTESTAAANESGKPPTDWDRVLSVLKNPHFVIFLVIGLTAGSCFTAINSYLFPSMEELGAGESIMGVALTIGTLVEIPLLFFANRIVRHFKPYPLVIFSLAMTGLRFLLMAFAPSAEFVLVLQLINAFGYALMVVAGVTYTEERAPEGFHATAQGMFNTAVFGIGGAIGGFAGGILFENIGGQGMYLSFFGFVCLVLVVSLVLRRVLPPEPEREPVPLVNPVSL